MVLNLHYRSKKEFSKPVFFLLDFLDKIPVIGSIFKVLIKRYKYEKYELTLNLDKINTAMLIQNNSNSVVSEMKFSELKEVVYDYNHKYESFAFYPTMATFHSKHTQNTLVVPLSKRSDFFKLQKELTSMGIKQRNNVRIKVWAVLLGAAGIGVMASYIIGPNLFDIVTSYVK